LEPTKGITRMTMETSAAWRARSNKLGRGFIGGSDARIVMLADEGTSNHDACRIQHWKEKSRKAERTDPQNEPQNLNRHWHARVSGGLPLRWHVVAVCYWTIVILLGWYPWNILLMLLALPAMDFSRRDQTGLCRDGCLVDTGHHDER
jgi:hypothetical protein